MDGKRSFAATATASAWLVECEAFHRFRADVIWLINDPSLLVGAVEEQDRRYQTGA
ncbi:MAG: hypothetical protein AAF683_06805 [Pseudomonadota bacterium]